MTRLLLWLACGLTFWGGLSVLRNPLKVPLNMVAGIAHVAGAIVGLLLSSWIALGLGWAFSILMQMLVTKRMMSGKYNAEVNAIRAARGLPPKDD